MSKVYTPIDPVRLGRVVVAAVGVQIVAELLLTLAHAYALTGPGQAFIDEDLRSSDLGVFLTSVFYLATYVVGGFIALKWIYRVNRNAHAFARGLSISPPWAVGWYFVPIATLWKPYEAMSEAWQATERPHAWRTAPKPAFLGWWWAAWLISNFVGGLANAVSKVTDDIATNSAVVIVGCLASIVADAFFIRVVNRLSSLQQTQINFGMFDEPAEAPGLPPLGGGVAEPQGA